MYITITEGVKSVSYSELRSSKL